MGNHNLSISRPFIFVLLIVFFINGASAYVFTTPPRGVFNETGIYFGNTSGDDKNYTADMFRVMNRFGITVGTYTDSYTCDASYCIYQPWYDSGKTYAKNMSTGMIDYSGTSATTVAQSAQNALINGGEIHFGKGTYTLNLNISNPKITVSGEGWVTNIIQSNGAIAALDINGDYATVRDISITQASSGAGSVFYLNKSMRFQASNLKITGTIGGTGTAIELLGAVGDAAHASQWTNIWILNPQGYGIYQKANSYDAQWTNVWIGNFSLFPAMRIESGANTYVNLHVWGNSTDTQDAIEIRSNMNRFISPYIEAARNGVSIYNTGTGAENNTIMGGYIANHQRSGVSISAGRWNKIIGVTFSNNRLGGSYADIQLAAAANNNTIIGNSIPNAVGLGGEGNIINDNQGYGAINYGNNASAPTTSPQEGSEFYNTTSKAYNFYDGSQWRYRNMTPVNSY